MAGIKEIMSMDLDTMLKMDRKELAKATSKMASAANKRLRRLEQSGMKTPASQWASRSGGDFSVKGKNLNQLRSEYARVRNFLGAKTSTHKGARQVQQEYEQRIGGPLSPENEKKFWELFHKTTEMEPAMTHVTGSPQILKMVREELDAHPEMSQDEIMENVEKNISELYEDMEGQLNEEWQDLFPEEEDDFFFM